MRHSVATPASRSSLPACPTSIERNNGAIGGSSTDSPDVDTYHVEIRAPLGRLSRAFAGPLIGSVVSVDTADPVVAFTFDDGPDPECTPAVLDALRSEQA